MAYINLSDFTNFIDFWQMLERKFFVRLSAEFHPTLTKLSNSLRKKYLITAVQTARADKVREFFEALSDEISNEEEWRPWFGTAEHAVHSY